MKKLYLFVLFYLFSVPSQASGPFDGIYMISANDFAIGYMTLREDANTHQMIAVILDPDPNITWTALSARRVGNTAIFATITGANTMDVDLTIRINFDSNHPNPTATIISCRDGATYSCIFPVGVTLNLIKTF